MTGMPKTSLKQTEQFNYDCSGFLASRDNRHIDLVPVLAVDPAKVLSYWTDLSHTPRFAARICDVVNPTIQTVGSMIEYNRNGCYYVQLNHPTGIILGEFMLNNFTGKAAQIHFSIHPTVKYRQAIPLVKHALKTLLTWNVKGRPEEPYLTTLVGLTPVTNRPACLFVLGVGFKKQFVLSNGIYDRGQLVDGMISTMTTRRK